MPTRLASTSELTAWAGSVDPTLAGIVLDAVSGSAIRLAVPVSASWTSGDTVPAEVKALILQVAARVVDNPTGLTSESFAGYASGRPDRGIVFTEAERSALLEAAGLVYESNADAFSVPLRPLS
jgi:hypothetical protein